MISKKVKDIQNDYFVWLCEIVGVDQLSKTYWKLARALDAKPYSWFIPNDDNRGYEAKNLREKFSDEYDVDFDEEFDPDEDATMLELLISLAYRCEDMVDLDDMKVDYFFWEMMRNCGLYLFDDFNWTDDVTDSAVEDILDRILDRSYDTNGAGGLFPLKHNPKNQRKIELWYQMNWYLVENYCLD